MASASPQDDRLHDELALLQAMYPEPITFEAKAREVKYSTGEISFLLRLPDGYLVDELPEILHANRGKLDLRESLKQFIQNSCQAGEEVLDSIILAFDGLCEESKSSASTEKGAITAIAGDAATKATVIVWLHHLVNTNKRKQALSPPAASVSGVTKPGYPGVLIYSGPADAVYEHVNELKHLNWQAFQVRFESEDEWSFAHGSGVVEVEAMKDVVAEVGEDRKAMFLEAMRMK